MNLKELCIIIQNMLVMNENEVNWDIRQVKWLSSSPLASPMTTSGYRANYHAMLCLAGCQVVSNEHD
jgi:hypothetical protein